ncbi:MAG: molybdopterin cofactor-binding domain-containing protein [Melioribacteraceae bacterium]|nr:molybdopterin cofactor-binding domain-containing protein [Melioribacteraceae bacterium]
MLISAGKYYEGKWICDWTTKPGATDKDIITHYSYSYATQVVILDDNGEIEKVIAAHDAGKIINPNLFEGQIEGSVHMGLGYAISEELVMKDGFPVSTNFRDLGILRARQMPEVEVIGVEGSGSNRSARCKRCRRNRISPNCRSSCKCVL